MPPSGTVDAPGGTGAPSDRAEVRHSIRFGLVNEHAILDMELSAQAFRLYALLCRYANTAGLAWPSQEDLAIHLGVKARQIRKLVTELGSRGHIEHVRPAPGRRSTYVVTWLSDRLQRRSWQDPRYIGAGGQRRHSQDRNGGTPRTAESPQPTELPGLIDPIRPSNRPTTIASPTADAPEPAWKKSDVTDLKGFLTAEITKHNGGKLPPTLDGSAWGTVWKDLEKLLRRGSTVAQVRCGLSWWADHAKGRWAMNVFRASLNDVERVGRGQSPMNGAGRWGGAGALANAAQEAANASDPSRYRGTGPNVGFEALVRLRKQGRL